MTEAEIDPELSGKFADHSVHGEASMMLLHPFIDLFGIGGEQGWIGHAVSVRPRRRDEYLSHAVKA